MADEDTTQGQTAAPSIGLGQADATPSPQGPGQEAEREATPEGERPDAEGESEEEATPESWWRQAESFDDLRKHESFQEWESDYREELEHEFRTELGRRDSRVARTWGEAQAATKEALQNVQGISERLEQAVKAGAVDPDDVKGVLPELKKIAPNVLQEQFVTGALSGLKSLSESITPGFYDAYEVDFFDVISSADPMAALQKLTERMLRQHNKKLRADVVAEYEKKERGRKDAETRQVRREREPAPARGGGSAGGSTKPDDVIRSRSATLDEKQEAFARKHGVRLDDVVPFR